MAKYLPDWVQYHRRIGVDKMYIYDNNSTDGMAALGRTLDGVEVIPWPWRRSQRQAYTHARLIGRRRCRWMLFMDLDQYIFAGDQPGGFASLVRRVTREPGAGGGKALADGDRVGGVQLRSRQMTTRDITQCPPEGVQVPEAYLDRKPDKQSWDPRTNGLVAPDECIGIHWIHNSYLRDGAVEVEVPSEDAHFLHYSYKCWREIFLQKFMGRNGVLDWKYDPSKVSPDKPIQSYVDGGRAATVRDTSFRDAKKLVQAGSVPVQLVLPPFSTEPVAMTCT